MAWACAAFTVRIPSWSTSSPCAPDKPPASGSWTNGMARRVLLVDPDLDALGELSAALRGNGFTVLLADNVESGVVRAKQDSPDIILASVAVCHPGELT